MNYKLLLIIILQLLCTKLFAEKYHCTINKAPAGKEIPETKIKEFVRHFEFQIGERKKFHFRNVEAYLWDKGEFLYITLKDLKISQEVTTKFQKTQKDISLTLTPNTEFVCLEQTLWNRKKNTKLTQLLTSKIEDSSDLTLFTKSVAVEIKKEMEFDYFQEGVNGQMRSLLFQNGKIVSRKKDGAWCIFQIQIALDENTIVEKDTVIEAITVDSLSNSSTEKVLSYSFVDFASGRTGHQTSRYIPFSLECSVPNEQTLTYGLFKKITGNRLAIRLQN